MDAQEIRDALHGMYGGENKPITDGNYDPSVAVKCINGTFVGMKKDDIIVYRGIPYVGKQPIGELRWKAPVDYVPDDGVYEAFYNAKSAYGNGQLETGSLYYLDEDCLYLNVFKSDAPTTLKKPVMVWIHGGAFEAGGRPHVRLLQLRERESRCHSSHHCLQTWRDGLPASLTSAGRQGLS
jgi:hypothetical protein